MVFSPGLSEEQFGHGIVVPFKSRDLVQEAECLWTAERDRGRTNQRISGDWGCIALVENPERPISHDVRQAWAERLSREPCYAQMFNTNAWPTLVNRLTALDRRLEYRTVYAAMCSQAHHDAEDVLNNFMANCHPDADRLAARTEREADTFSVFMVLFGLRWFVEAVHDVCSSFKFPTVVVQAKSSLGRLHRELEMMTKHLDSGEFPETWTTDSAPSSNTCVFVDHDRRSPRMDTIPHSGALSVGVLISEQLHADPCYARHAPDVVGPRAPERLAIIAKPRGGVVTTSTLYFFVDTNLFIQCQAPEQLDWSPWHDFEEVKLIVSTPVLREIDSLKTRGGRAGKRARAASAKFRQMRGQSHKVVHAQSPRVVLSVEPQHTYSQDLADRLNYAERDDQLIGTIHQFARSNPTSDVRLLTHDTIPLYTAQGLDLTADQIPR